MSNLARMAVLGAAAIGIVSVNIEMGGTPVDISPIAAPARTPGNMSAGGGDSSRDDPARLSDLTFVQTFSRPLFSPNRRKYVAPPPPKKQQAKPAPVAKSEPQKQETPVNVQLVGISISGAYTKALVQTDLQPDPLWVSVGEKIGPWTVSEIGSGAITITADDRVVSINLYPEAP